MQESVVKIILLQELSRSINIFGGTGGVNILGQYPASGVNARSHNETLTIPIPPDCNCWDLEGPLETTHSVFSTYCGLALSSLTLGHKMCIISHSENCKPKVC